MRRTSTQSVISLLTVAITFVVGTLYLTFGVARFDPFAQRTQLTIHLPQASGLIARSPVLLSGVRIGTVTGVRNEGSRVTVKLQVDSRRRVPTDSRVRIENLSGLGEAYILFMPKTSRGPYLRAGQIVDTRQIVPPVSISELAHVSTQMIAQVNPKSVASIVETFHGGLDGTDDVIARLSRSTDLLAAVLSSRNAEIRRLLINTQAHLHDMQWMGPSLRAAAAPWTEFGPKVSALAESVGRVARKGKLPDDYTTGMGLIPFLDKMIAWTKNTGPDFKALAAASSSLQGDGVSFDDLDLGQLIADALAATPDDGALHLQLAVK